MDRHFKVLRFDKVIVDVRVPTTATVRDGALCFYRYGEILHIFAAGVWLECWEIPREKEALDSSNAS